MVIRAEQLRVFIAFTADCVEERHAVGRIVAEDTAIAALRRELNLSVELFDWTSVGPDAGRPQGLINAAVERFDPDWIVFILWHRMGSDTGCGGHLIETLLSRKNGTGNLPEADWFISWTQARNSSGRHATGGRTGTLGNGNEFPR